MGSGAGGGPAAYALTRAGWKVLVLEKGPRYTEKDFTHDELTICRRTFFTPSPADEPNMLVGEDGQTAKPSSDGWISCCVGGGTVHMSGYFFRMHREDFRVRTLYGYVSGASPADWPIQYEDLEPFYDQVESMIGVSGDSRGNSFEPRRKPYPLGPILTHGSSALVEGACRRLGLKPFQIPRAIISSEYHGRQACAYCGFCGSYGCEFGSKSSTPVTFLSAAAKSGHLTLLPQAMAAEIKTDAKGRASGVVYIDSKNARHEVRSRVVILACSSIQTARLLLFNKLANSSGLLGRNLMFATYSGGWGRFPLPNRYFPASPRELPFLDRAVQDFYVARDSGLKHPKVGTILFLLPHLNPIYRAELAAAAEGEDPPLWGAALKKRLTEVFRETRTIEVECFGEFLPHPGCDVTLDPTIKDKFGLPVARLRMGIAPPSLAASNFLSDRGRAVLEAAGAAKVGAYRGSRTYAFLQAGTARMGNPPGDSVVDSTCQSHDVKNLYLADASTFPSSGGAPFTLTIMANSLRIAAEIVRRGKAHSL